GVPVHRIEHHDLDALCDRGLALLLLVGGHLVGVRVDDLDLRAELLELGLEERPIGRLVAGGLRLREEERDLAPAVVAAAGARGPGAAAGGRGAGAGAAAAGALVLLVLLAAGRARGDERDHDAGLDDRTDRTNGSHDLRLSSIRGIENSCTAR